VVEATRAQLPDVLVVDDGSHDDTAAVAARAGARVLKQGANQGKGAALLAAFRELVAGGVTHVVTLDADGQHLPEEIPRLVQAAHDTPGAIVVGERLKEGHDISAVARFGNWVADTLLRRIAGQRLPDTQSGFRVYPVAETLALGARGDRFDFETEVLLRAGRAGMPVVGVPVRVHYPPPEERVSHYDKWTDTLRIIRTVVRLMAERG
jgi:glycosyltransferase involved in cell wall biosynthesis